MPTESNVPPIPLPSASGSSHHPFQLNGIKCSMCGAGGTFSSPLPGSEGVVVLSEPIERICGGCVRAQENERREDMQGIGLSIGVGSPGALEKDRGDEQPMESVESPCPIVTQPLGIRRISPSPPLRSCSQSLPNQHTRPWTTISTTTSPILETRELTTSPTAPSEDTERPPNPLLDVTKVRIPSIGRGALYPGSVFRGTQTSGRSAFEVEVRFLVSTNTTVAQAKRRGLVFGSTPGS